MTNNTFVLDIQSGLLDVQYVNTTLPIGADGLITIVVIVCIIIAVNLSCIDITDCEARDFSDSCRK